MNKNNAAASGGGGRGKASTKGTLRGLMFCGGAACLMSFFLAGLHFYMKWFAQTATVPFCGWGVDWLDCDTVLNDPKWSVWMGGSVASLGVLVYVFGVMLPLVFLRNVERANGGAMEGVVGGDTWVRRAWLTLYGSALVIVLSAMWFVGLQVFVIGKLCWFCMVEHALGITVGVMIWRKGKGVFRTLGASCFWPRMAAVFLVGLLVGGQMTSKPVYQRQVKDWGLDEAGRYIETEDESKAVELGGGGVVLSRDEHPMIGATDAGRVIVKVLDYTCPRCKNVNTQLGKVRSMMGVEAMAVLVVHFPLSDTCNTFMDYTDERHIDACRMAELAKAVWRAEPGQFEVYHEWLFANQEGMTAEAALVKAEQLVGAKALGDALEGDVIGALIQRDVKIGTYLGVSQLPGLFAGRVVFDSVPSDEHELLELLNEAFEMKVEQAP